MAVNQGSEKGQEKLLSRLSPKYMRLFRESIGAEEARSEVYGREPKPITVVIPIDELLSLIGAPGSSRRKISDKLFEMIKPYMADLMLRRIMHSLEVGNKLDKEFGWTQTQCDPGLDLDRIQAWLNNGGQESGSGALDI